MRIVSLVLLALVSATAQSLYPITKRVDVVDVMHGVSVADPYRWLEDLESDETRQWIKAQDELTRRQTAGEAYDIYRARIERLANVRRYTTPIRRGDRWFFFETDSNGSSGRVLLMKTAPNATPKPLVDLRSKGPDALARVMSPSPNGTWVAYGEAINGSRWLQLRLIAPATGQTSDETLTDLHSSMGSIGWLPDGKSFLYVRFDPPHGPHTSAPVTGAAIMQHVIGTPQSQDVRIFHLSDSPRRIYGVTVSDDGRWIVVTTSIGASTQQVFVRPVATPRASFSELFARTPGQFSFLGSKGEQLWFLTSVGAPRYRIIRVDAHRPGPANWTTTVPEPGESESITYANLVAERLIVMSTRDAAPRVRIHSLIGELERELPLPPLSTVWGPTGGGAGFGGRTTDHESYFIQSGIADPGSIYRLNPQTGKTELFLRPTFGFETTDFIGRQVFYTGRDGTRIPMFIAHHKNVRPDGARAAFMYGYGALKWSAFPWFQPHILAWMEAGGVYALPGLRGGGEYGDRWHEAAVREKKQTSVDDYLSAAEWLVANKYAAEGMVVANGGSISGAVAAAAVVQRPALFGATVIDIPALDLLRYDRHTGAASWIPEFGSTTVPREFHALRALSPYHNVKAGVCYPPTLVLAGEKDDIAVPSHAYKFVAALQHTQSCANPALLQVAWGAAHTFGTSNESSADNWARQLAFVSGALKINPATPRLTASVLPEVRAIGTGDTAMVLIPCMSCRWSSWEPFMERNADRWRTYAVTLPGFGGTRPPDVPMNTNEALWHDNAVAAVSRLLDEEDLRDIVLVGHSFGSAIALQVAAKRPDRVRALVNIDGPLTSPRSWFPAAVADRPSAARAISDRNAVRYAEAEAWRTFNAAAASLSGDRQTRYHGMFMATPRDVLFQYWRENVLRDLNPLLRGLSQPVLDLKMVGPADRDPDTTRSAHLQMMRESGAPTSVQSVFFYNTGHFVQDQRPALLEERIASFLAGQEVTDARPSVLPGIALPAEFGHIERIGSGQVPLILMPCLGCDWRAFDEYMARNRSKYRMYAVTWPGLGTTPLPRVASGDMPLLDNVAAATVRLIREERLSRPILIAHSAAGPLAIKLAAEHADLLGGVITVDSTIQNNDTLGFSPAQRRAWADAEMAKVLRDHDDPAAWLTLNSASAGTTTSAARTAMYEQMWRTPPREHVLRYWREWLRLDSGSLLPSISVPTRALFAISEKAPAPDANRHAVSDQFRRNRASSAVSIGFIHPATHSIWETAPVSFDAAVDTFVAELSAQPRSQSAPATSGSGPRH